MAAGGPRLTAPGTLDSLRHTLVPGEGGGGSGGGPTAQHKGPCSVVRGMRRAPRRSARARRRGRWVLGRGRGLRSPRTGQCGATPSPRVLPGAVGPGHRRRCPAPDHRRAGRAQARVPVDAWEALTSTTGYRYPCFTSTWADNKNSESVQSRRSEVLRTDVSKQNRKMMESVKRGLR